MTVVKKRRLGDLFLKGDNLTIEDSQGSITVWVQKLNPVESDNALRKANAARARLLSARKDKESEEYLSMESDTSEMSVEEIIEFLMADDLSKRLGPIEAEVTQENGWNNDDYLQGLSDAWEGGGEDSDEPALKDYINDDDEEVAHIRADAERVQGELLRHSKEVADALEVAQAELRKMWSQKGEPYLREKLFEYLWKLRGDLEWALEFRKAQLLYGVRDAEKHSQKYFHHRDEIDTLDDKVLSALLTKMSQLEVGPEEGKDLPETPASSSPSDSAKTPEDSLLTEAGVA